jgi:hypothetical protein
MQPIILYNLLQHLVAATVAMRLGRPGGTPAGADPLDAAPARRLAC